LQPARARRVARATVWEGRIGGHINRARGAAHPPITPSRPGFLL
jgi:hypothetical protein